MVGGKEGCHDPLGSGNGWVKGGIRGLEDVLNGATIEEKRELIGRYVKTIKAEPDTQAIPMSLYPAVFNKMVAGDGFDGVKRRREISLHYR